MADRLRLKQIVFNLANNSKKFVQHGFIRINVELINNKHDTTTTVTGTNGIGTNTIQISVEDSGPGIPKHKHGKLFARYQDSLDSLCQGTGMGLSLVKSLVELMDGNVCLDESYDSGIIGGDGDGGSRGGGGNNNNRGTRFVITLNNVNVVVPSSSDDDYDDNNIDIDIDINNDEGFTKKKEQKGDDKSILYSDVSEKETISSLVNNNYDNGDVNNTATISPNKRASSCTNLYEIKNGKKNNVSPSSSSISSLLPRTLSVLVVDDDLVLRKLLSRSIKRVAPEWTIHEAANGETCLSLIQDKSNKFDLIFIDQYMASIDKQLLGTETTFALRAKGYEGRICGLSANYNTKKLFLNSGANAFMLKPFKCEREALTLDLLHVLGIDNKNNNTNNDSSLSSGNREHNVILNNTAAHTSASSSRSLSSHFDVEDSKKNTHTSKNNTNIDSANDNTSPNAKSNTTTTTDKIMTTNNNSNSSIAAPSLSPELPESISVLLVDDDPVLRKLISRSIKRVAPKWHVQDAPSGEVCLQIVKEKFHENGANKKKEEGEEDDVKDSDNNNNDSKTQQFDLIFLDQYMSSPEEHKLLGTETCSELRKDLHFKGIICGFSANDVKDEFIKSGADYFLNKPINCRKDALALVLKDVLGSSTST